MTSGTVALRSRRVLTAAGLRPATVHVIDGRIAAIVDKASGGPVADSGPVADYGNLAVLPGFVDTHVHVNEPGRTHWEGFPTATRAAAAAGITTIIDMPLNCVPPTTSVAALHAKQEAAEGRCDVDVGFWGGLVPDNLDELEALDAAGVFGFKAFLADSGVAEFAHVEPGVLAEGMHRLAAIDALMVAHAEDAGVLSRAANAGARYPRRTHSSWLATRPPEAEVRAVERLADHCMQAGTRVHVVHVSSAAALYALSAARSDGATMTAETCPHYLTFTAEEIPDGDTTFKCAPPIREASNREQLWRGLSEGLLSVVVSDHSPSPVELKHLDSGDFTAAWGGISSLQLGPSAVWTQARRRRHGLDQVARWMSTGPAALARLPRKGRIAVGYDADLVVFDPEATFEVDPLRLHHRHPVTPYAGRTLSGVVRATYLRGQQIFGQDEQHHGQGRLLRKAPA